jgi:hypothetical protein
MKYIKLVQNIIKKMKQKKMGIPLEKKICWNKRE